jgi:ubiquitin-conjugating enzyme E2 J1
MVDLKLVRRFASVCQHIILKHGNLHGAVSWPEKLCVFPMHLSQIDCNNSWCVLVRTVLLAIIGFMPSKGGGAIGALDYTSQERKILARK